MTPRRQTLCLLALGILLGISVWLFSRWLTGKVEPWDADTPIWPFSWLLVAILGGIVGHVRGVCVPLGYALGQGVFVPLGYALRQMLVTVQSRSIGEFGILGWMFIAGYMGIAVAITLSLVGVIALIKWLLRRRTK